MFCKLKDFVSTWAREREATLKIMNALTDESLNVSASTPGRTLGHLAWHIVQMNHEMMERTGLPGIPPIISTPPIHAKEIVKSYEHISELISDKVIENWSDASLSEELNIFGQTWSKGFILVTLITHQIHHRGQMTVLMRLAGIRVPGIYGPAREEWAAMGMDAPA